MLATYVLRNIVLPHLRSATTASTSAAAAGQVASRSRATISTSVRHARAAEAVLAEREDLRWESFQARLHDLPRAHVGAHVVSRDVGPGRAPKREEKQPSVQCAPKSQHPPHTDQHHRQRPTELTSTDAIQRPVEASQSVSLAETRPCARADLPPAIAKLLHAKLYRLVVFQVLDTPEYMADPALIAYVVHVLEKNGAGKLARRLSKAFEAPSRTRDGKLRLMSEPSSTHRRPPDYWRMPLVPRPLDAFPEPTRQERLTHAHNLTITRLLTVTHPIPYASPFPHTRSAPLRRLRDVLQHVEELRTHRGFVPDRVTANIVVKAWLSCLARNTSRGERGLSRQDLRDIFQLVSDSFEFKSNPLDGDEGTSSATGSGVAGKSALKGSSKTTGKADGTQTTTTKPPVFDPRVDYERHVQPFAKMMVRAMVRVGDHAGRKCVEKWVAGQAKKLGIETSSVSASREKKRGGAHHT